MTSKIDADIAILLKAARLGRDQLARSTSRGGGRDFAQEDELEALDRVLAKFKERPHA